MRFAAFYALPLFLLGAQPSAPPASAIVEVQLANYKFTPEVIVLARGQSYVLRLRNVAGGGHDFTAPAFFAASTVDPADQLWITEGQVEVPAGLIRDIRLAAPAGAGRYKVKCTHAFHAMFGMSGTIVVQ
jgi:uncharacterized cupredoxin-like copper-binding protein